MARKGQDLDNTKFTFKPQSIWKINQKTWLKIIGDKKIQVTDLGLTYMRWVCLKYGCQCPTSGWMRIRDTAEGHLYGVLTGFMASEASSLDAAISSWRSKNNWRASSTATKERVAALASAATAHLQQRATMSDSCTCCQAKLGHAFVKLPGGAVSLGVGYLSGETVSEAHKGLSSSSTCQLLHCSFGLGESPFPYCQMGTTMSTWIEKLEPPPP